MPERDEPRQDRVIRTTLAVLVGLALALGPLRGAPEQQAGPASGAGGSASAAVPAQEDDAEPGRDSVVGRAGMTPEALDALTARVAAQLRCPVCRNQSVLESSATLSQEMQAEIRRRLASGDSPEEVRAYFVDRYGEWILLKPRAEGLNLLVYVLPAAALLLGGFLVWRLLIAWSATPAEEPAAGRREAPGRTSGGDAEGLDPEEEERLEAVLRGENGGGGAP